MPRRLLTCALTIALAAFAIIHGLALFNVGSGVAVFGRVMAWTPPAVVSALLYGWFGCVFVTVVSQATRAWTETPGAERVFALWPIAYMAVFPAFRLDAPVRHYLILIFLLIASATSAMPKLPARWAHIVLVQAAVTFLVVHAFVWRELRHPVTRRPMTVRVGWVHDTSKHFIALDPLYQVIRDEHACTIVSPEAFMEKCLQFFVATHDLACDPRKTLTPDYCPECPGPPYLKWQVVVR